MSAFSWVKVPSAGGSTKCIARGKGVYCEVESEGSLSQSTDLTNRNDMRHAKGGGKSAKQDEAPSHTEPEV